MEIGAVEGVSETGDGAWGTDRLYSAAAGHSNGLPIGSGEIESARRYIVQQRLKRPGAWWTPDNAEGMLALRIHRANGQWNAYWQDTLKQAA